MKSFADLTQTGRREDRAARVAPVAREASTLEELQQALGNRALTQLLSPAPARPSYTVTADGIGTFKAKAFIGPERRTGGGGGRPIEQEPDREPKESARFSFSIVKPMDAFTATLQFYEREGRHIPSLEVALERSLRRIVLRFTDVLVVSFRPDTTTQQETERLEEVGFEGSLDQKNSRF